MHSPFLDDIRNVVWVSRPVCGSSWSTWQDSQIQKNYTTRNQDLKQGIPNRSNHEVWKIVYFAVAARCATNIVTNHSQQVNSALTASLSPHQWPSCPLTWALPTRMTIQTGRKAATDLLVLPTALLIPGCNPNLQICSSALQEIIGQSKILALGIHQISAIFEIGDWWEQRWATIEQRNLRITSKSQRAKEALSGSETPLKQFYGVGAFEAFGFFAFVPWTDCLQHTASYKTPSKEDHLRLLHLSSSRQHRHQRPLVGRQQQNRLPR